MTARLVIAAPASGSGKTTVTAGLIRAFVRRGLAVQPFKCGPDYIDPSYHTLAAQRSCRNLDSWLLSANQIHELFACAGAAADLALIEGVMGLFDGVNGQDDRGSTAEMARLLRAPVVLVIDARGMARSVAALVAGFHHFDPRVPIAGVILNRVGSPRHAALCADAIASAIGLPCFGYVPRRDDCAFPQRHLGLVPTGEDYTCAARLDQIAALLSETCDLDAVLALARSAPPLTQLEPAPVAPPIVTADSAPVIAVAQDAAFSFAYPEMHELLTAAGATIAPFSPLTDPTLPLGTAGIILSGGFPEVYAEALSRNQALHAAIRAAHAAGLPIYAECGGLMYLTETLIDQQGQAWPIVGLLGGSSRMTDRVRLGYRTVRAPHDTPLLQAGTTVRGHEFHYSRWQDRPTDLPHAYDLLSPTGELIGEEGAQIGNLLASYVHLHWLAQPDMARRFVEHCRAH